MKGGQPLSRAARLPRRVVVGAAAAAAAALLAPRSLGGQVPLHLLVGFDVSGSIGPPERRRQCQALAAIVDRDLPLGAEVTVLRFARGVEKLYEGVPRSRRDLGPVVGLLQSAPAPPGKGTCPAPALRFFLETMLAESGALSPGGWAVLLFTDGEDSDRAATAGCIDRLKGLASLRAAWLCGVLPAERLAVERRWRGLTHRLVVSGEYDLRDARERFRMLVSGRK